MNLVFDYDGTLHDSIVVYEPAFRYVMSELERREGIVVPCVSQENIRYWIGLSAPDMWNSFMPELSQESKDFYSGLIGDMMVAFINEGKARLYPRALETLGRLKEQGHELFFLSNCSCRYLQAHRSHFSLDEHFTAFYCAEDFGWQPKSHIFSQMKESWPQLNSAMVIGDRRLDIAFAVDHGCTSVGCTYGYAQPGELAQADYLIDDLSELLLLV